MIYAGVPSFFGSRFGDGHVPTFWSPLYRSFDHDSDCIGGSSHGKWEPPLHKAQHIP